MLRVGLTGGLGSGKSTVGRFFVELGANVIDADEVGRKLMQPGKAVYQQIVEHFGQGVVRHDGGLDRRALAELAFSGGRLEELNRIVHPAVIAVQEAWLREVSAADPSAVAIIESALIFEASRKASAVPGWRERFDRIILVTAPDEFKIRRFVERSGGENVEADARKRLASQIPDSEKIAYCDWVIDNSGKMEETRTAVVGIYGQLKKAAIAF